MTRSAFFPGQGAQVVGMGQVLATRSPAIRRMYDEASEVLGYDLADVCWNGPKAARFHRYQPAGPVRRQPRRPGNTQPGRTRRGRQVRRRGRPESRRVHRADVRRSMSFADGLRVVKAHGEAMQAAADATAGGMVSILALNEIAVIEEICAAASASGPIRIANLLCPGNTVVSGSVAACDAVEKLVEAKGGRTMRLAVAGAFHTPLMKPADETLAAALAGVTIRPPRVPGLVQRGRQAAYGPRRDSRPAGAPSRGTRFVGTDDARAAGRWLRPFLRDRAGPRAERTPETGQPSGTMR